MKKIKDRVCVFLFLGFLSASLFGYEYIMSDKLMSWIMYYTAATTKITSWAGGTDFGHFDLAVPAGCEFYFYGKKVTHIRIHTKGYVTFGFGSAPTGGTQFPSTIPSPGTADGLAAPFWDDFDLTNATGTDGVYYYISTNNFILIEWRNVPLYGDSTKKYSFELWLLKHTHYNLSDVIFFTYSSVAPGSASHDYGKAAVVGIEHPEGTQGEQYSAGTASLSNGKWIHFTPFVPVYGGTYNIYGTSNVPVMTVWRPSNGYWFYRLPNGTMSYTQYGINGDIPLPGDWNGDGKAEPCVLRPSTYQWFCANPAFVIPWGTDGDIPVPADYDGVGQLDIAVFRPGGWVSTPGTWFIYHRHSGASQVFQWGTQGDIPMPADYDGDGKADLAVYRPASNTWYIRKSSNPATSWVIPYGTDGDIPFAGQFYWGTPYSDVCVFRPSNGYWFFKNPQYGNSGFYQWGQNGDVPMPSDETVGGVSDFCVFRPQTNGMWFIQSHLYYAAVTSWGTLGDKPRFRRSTAIIAPPGNTGK